MSIISIYFHAFCSSCLVFLGLYGIQKATLCIGLCELPALDGGRKPLGQGDDCGALEPRAYLGYLRHFEPF